MFSAAVICIDCGDKVLMSVESDNQKDLGARIASAVITCHAAPPHCSHSLRVGVDLGVRKHEDSDLWANSRNLTIRCFRCPQAKILQENVPPWLVPALTVVFHSDHEGHPIELTYDGRTYVSPPKQ